MSKKIIDDWTSDDGAEREIVVFTYNNSCEGVTKYYINKGGFVSKTVYDIRFVREIEGNGVWLKKWLKSRY